LNEAHQYQLWSSETTYNTGDFVFAGDQWFYCRNNTVTTDPLTDFSRTNWDLFLGYGTGIINEGGFVGIYNCTFENLFDGINIGYADYAVVDADIQNISLKNVLRGVRIIQNAGKINIGDTVVFGNFSQQGLVIKDDMRVIEYVKSFAENFPLANGASISAAQFLELFLFTPDKQYTYLSALSGGEKKRLQLLVVLFRNPNFLILDEPTNDLDLPTLAVLESFLSDYPGCVLIVSHDRYFMDRLVDHLFVFEGNGEVRDFPGNYSQYRIWQKENEKSSNKWDALEAGKRKGETTENIVQQKAATPVPQKKTLSYKEKKEFEQLEKEIPELEKEKQSLTDELSTGTLAFDAIQKISDRLIAITNSLEEKELRWLELSE
jgi:ATP-binding cassette subfamily F protein uup